MNDVLSCKCGSHDLRITAQSYSGERTFEGYKCGVCSRTGTLTHDGITGTTLTGCLR